MDRHPTRRRRIDALPAEPCATGIRAADPRAAALSDDAVWAGVRDAAAEMSAALARLAARVDEAGATGGEAGELFAGLAGAAL